VISRIPTLIAIALLLTTSANAQKYMWGGPIKSVAFEISEHDWSIGTGRTRVGLAQWQQCRDADGDAVPIIDGKPLATVGITWRRYTRVFLGPRTFTVNAPAWTVALSSAASIALLFWLAFSIVRWRGKKNDHAG
jgi:hypothetical protein